MGGEWQDAEERKCIKEKQQEVFVRCFRRTNEGWSANARNSKLKNLKFKKKN